jgi:hypothetical protein
MGFLIAYLPDFEETSSSWLVKNVMLIQINYFCSISSHWPILALVHINATSMVSL